MLGSQSLLRSHLNYYVIAVGYALAAADRTLVYGGGSKGIMGVVSGSVLEKGGKVIGVIPQAMIAAGGEKDKLEDGSPRAVLEELGREAVRING